MTSSGSAPRGRDLHIAVAAAAALHALALGVVPERTPAAATDPSSASLDAIELEMYEPSQASEPADPEPSRPRIDAPRAVVAPPYRRAPPRDPTAGAVAPPRVAAPAPVATAAPSQTEPSEPSPDLSPRRAVVLAYGAASEGDPRDPAAERSAELSRSLAQAVAETTAYRRPRLDLHCAEDRECAYRGQTIEATILADGTVHFRDLPNAPQILPGVEEPPERPVSPDDAVAPQRLELRFRYHARGSAAEREWFMRETRALREERMARHARRSVPAAP